MKRILLVSLLCLLSACSSMKKIESIKKTGIAPTVLIPSKDAPQKIAVDMQTSSDTLKVRDSDGREMLIMRAIRDEKGEMVANETLGAAVVTAKFKNVAERGGKVDLHFEISVPSAIIESDWQLRLFPRIAVGKDTMKLEPVYITGELFRKRQLKGYQQYRRFLSTIITDSTKFINLYDLEVFLSRNLPQIYALRADSSFVSDAQFMSYYGVSEREAVSHYTRTFLQMMNERRKAKTGKMFRRYVKTPFADDDVRADLSISEFGNDYVYDYVQTLNVRRGMRKADVFISGQIFEQGKMLYGMAETGPVTFYISSISTLVDNTMKYKTIVIERKENASAVWDIMFRQGDSRLDTMYMENAVQLGSVKKTIEALSSDRIFDLDSVNVSSSCSPEGSFKFNRSLSLRRAESVAKWLSSDSIKFVPVIEGENWNSLSRMVSEDRRLEPEQKTRFSAVMKIKDPDKRELSLQRERFFPYVKDSLYPRMRSVRLDFHLHRKGMLRDTVHTTEPDSVYMNGLELIKSRDYLGALSRLLPYSDYNTAVCYVCLDRNHSALEILKSQPVSSRTLYLLALVYSRLGDDPLAVECYINACKENPSLVHRGNLDPEISSLVKKYNINLLQNN